MENKLYKVGDKVPKAGKYRCIICGHIVEFKPSQIKGEVRFTSCPVCLSGTEEGPKKPDEDFWEYIES